MILLNLLNVPGAIVSLQSPVYNSFTITYGYSNLESKKYVQVDDRFRIGSNTKMYVGIVLLQLYQEGLVDLDALVSKYLLGLPEFFANLTVREVGSMQSGIPDIINNLELQKAVAENPYRNWLTDELYSIAAIGTPLFEPGKKTLYSNSNSIVLALIIERLTGNPI